MRDVRTGSETVGIWGGKKKTEVSNRKGTMNKHGIKLDKITSWSPPEDKCKEMKTCREKRRDAKERGKTVGGGRRRRQDGMRCENEEGVQDELSAQCLGVFFVFCLGA